MLVEEKLEAYCVNNDHVNALKTLDTMRDMKKAGEMDVSRFGLCLFLSANAFADNDNLEFFKVYQKQMQDINTIDPTINKFNRKACSYYYIVQWKDHIMALTNTDESMYSQLAVLLANLSVTNNKWLTVLPKEIYSDPDALFSTLRSHINNCIPLNIST